ncbi:hypothetical protein [Streptomyces sp. NPDC059928]|uniref:hypothetical protein n=1 Tax=unclassified Streptomyces TaxID=2593676 RepID=UPI003665E7E7
MGALLDYIVNILVNGVHPVLIGLDSVRWVTEGWKLFFSTKNSKGAAESPEEKPASVNPEAEQMEGVTTVAVTDAPGEKGDDVRIVITSSRGRGRKNTYTFVLKHGD